MHFTKWLNRDFESSSSLTYEFQSFYKDIRAFIKSELGMNFDFEMNRGHFYFSGFVKNKATGKCAYFSASDVRFFKDDWHKHLLARTAKDNKDYTGGNNNYTTLANIKNALINLTNI